MLAGFPWWQVLSLVGLGMVAGGSSGLLGIGGGVIMVPAMVLLFAFGQQVAQGTALAVMIPTAFVGACTYAGKHVISWPAAVMMMVGSVIGARYGASLAMILPKELLRTLFALLFAVVAVRMMPHSKPSEMGLLGGVFIIAAALRLLVWR